MKDFFDYKIKNEPNDEIDYDSLVRDIWKEYGYPGKLATIGLVMDFAKGRLNPKLVIESFERIVNENQN